MDLTVKDDMVKFALKFGPNNWSFDGKVAGKRIKGSLDLGGDMLLVDLVPSKLKSLTKDKFAAAREALDTGRGAGRTSSTTCSRSSARRPPRSSSRRRSGPTPTRRPSWPSRTAPAGSGRSPSGLPTLWPTRSHSPPSPSNRPARASGCSTRTDDIATQLQTLDTLARVLRKAKKDADAKEVEGRIAKLEPRDYAEYAKTMPPFKPEEYKGRKGKSDRAVLVELFTGAECAPVRVGRSGLRRARPHL